MDYSSSSSSYAGSSPVLAPMSSVPHPPSHMARAHHPARLSTKRRARRSPSLDSLPALSAPSPASSVAWYPSSSPPALTPPDSPIRTSSFHRRKTSVGEAKIKRTDDDYGLQLLLLALQGESEHIVSATRKGASEEEDEDASEHALRHRELPAGARSFGDGTRRLAPHLAQSSARPTPAAPTVRPRHVSGPSSPRPLGPSGSDHAGQADSETMEIVLDIPVHLMTSYSPKQAAQFDHKSCSTSSSSSPRRSPSSSSSPFPRRSSSSSQHRHHSQLAASASTLQMPTFTASSSGVESLIASDRAPRSSLTCTTETIPVVPGRAGDDATATLALATVSGDAPRSHSQNESFAAIPPVGSDASAIGSAGAGKGSSIHEASESPSSRSGSASLEQAHAHAADNDTAQYAAASAASAFSAQSHDSHHSAPNSDSIILPAEPSNSGSVGDVPRTPPPRHATLVSEEEEDVYSPRQSVVVRPRLANLLSPAPTSPISTFARAPSVAVEAVKEEERASSPLPPPAPAPVDAFAGVELQVADEEQAPTEAMDVAAEAEVRVEAVMKADADVLEMELDGVIDNQLLTQDQAEEVKMEIESSVDMDMDVGMETDGVSLSSRASSPEHTVVDRELAVPESLPLSLPTPEPSSDALSSDPAPAPSSTLVNISTTPAPSHDLETLLQAAPSKPQPKPTKQRRKKPGHTLTLGADEFQPESSSSTTTKSKRPRKTVRRASEAENIALDPQGDLGAEAEVVAPKKGGRKRKAVLDDEEEIDGQDMDASSSSGTKPAAAKKQRKSTTKASAPLKPVQRRVSSSPSTSTSTSASLSIASSSTSIDAQEATRSPAVQALLDAVPSSVDLTSLLIDILVFGRLTFLSAPDLAKRLVAEHPHLASLPSTLSSDVYSPPSEPIPAPAKGKHHQDMGSKADLALWTALIRNLVSSQSVFGRIERSGLDPDGKKLEDVWFYEGSMDPDTARAATLADFAPPKRRKAKMGDRTYFYAPIDMNRWVVAAELGDDA